MKDSIKEGDDRSTHGWRIAGWSLVALLLALPMAAMQFTDEVNWTAGDFAFAAVVLLGSGLLLELAVRARPERHFRAGSGVAVLAAVLLLWLTGAVGIIGSEEHPANALYLLVLAVAVLGALWARFRPGGMAKAMLGAAALQAVIAIAALVAGWGPPGVDALRTLVLNGVFVLLWLLSAALFRAARDT